MKEEDQGPKTDDPRPPEPADGIGNGSPQQQVEDQALPGITPGSGATGMPWPPSPSGTGWPSPPVTGWPSGPTRRSFYREHPILVIFLFLLFGVAFMTIIWSYFASKEKSGSSISAVSFGKKVGVVKVEGLILDAKKIVDQIHRYRDDRGVTAVVVRVDSPGGTVGASQERYEEVKKLSEEKPVVVSMGTVAASGGYYVSCPASLIFANPGTITGSIGVVMEVTNLEGLFDWMKVKNQVIKSGEYKDTGSPYREMTKKEREYLQEFVTNVHLQFEKAVAEGRDLSMEEVHEISDGRIYSGAQARELGLVDEIGNLWDAIDEAALRGGIKGKPKVLWPPRQRPGFLLDFLDNILPGLAEASGVIPSPVRVMYIMDIH